MHAIGDRGNRIVLDAYEAALAAVPTADHRFRMEHAQILAPRTIPRFAQLGVIPRCRRSHQTSDMYWVARLAWERHVSGRLCLAVAAQYRRDHSERSDFPVESVNPLFSFHSAVSRQDAASGPAGGWYPEQRMTPR